MMTIEKIKSILSKRIGLRVVIIYYGSRNRVERYDGYIFRLYRNVFTVKLLNGEVKCFSYADVLTKTIKICC